MNRVWIVLPLLCFGMRIAVAQEQIEAEGAEINRFAEDYSDVAVAYGIRTPDGKITVTLYVYTDDSDSPKSMNDFQSHFAALKAQIGRAFGGSVKTIPVSGINWPHWLIAEVEVSTEEAPPFRSVLLLQTCGKWYTKARASFSNNMAQRFQSEGRAVVQLITCPADT